ncbi:hypothetical protein [Occallatibacter riparius]|uniref:Uncharacterized protein n=1 Tax=Occallatibacter riparius TaxID=1002689 RepID=A0A9J7BQ06_9BACT|nr:hypothetical protein [Occallatibacter riparius]UWZ84964.1 hypothetical protein MOP44_03250 [Occallatibacter riparius]
MDELEFIRVVSDLQSKLEEAKEQASGGQLTGDQISAMLPSLFNLDSTISFTGPSGYKPQPVPTKGSKPPSGTK